MKTDTTLPSEHVLSIVTDIRQIITEHILKIVTRTMQEIYGEKKALAQSALLSSV